MDVATLINEVRAMKPADREMVLAALDEPDDGQGLFSEEQLAELDRRLDAFEAGKLACQSWDVVKARWQSRK
jgi:putative addiction module component (TIGR02574 family)